MNPNLVLIAPNEVVAEVAHVVIKDGEFNCQIMLGNLNQGAILARQAEKSGAEAIISRGGTFLAIQQAVRSTPVVPINVSSIDLYDALHKATDFEGGLKGKIGIVGYPNMIYDASSLGRHMNLEVLEIPVENPAQLEEQLPGEIEKGLSIVVGDTISVEIALKLGIQGVLISSGKRAIYSALKRAEEMALLRRKEVLAQNRLRAILDAVAEGILAVDDDWYVTHCNPTVQDYLGLAEEKILGKPVEKLLPRFQGNEDLVTLGGQQYVLNLQVIEDKGDRVSGHIIILRPLKQIQETETRLRKKLYTRGHVARHTFGDIVGESERIRTVVGKAGKISSSNATVLIMGPTGAGKEMFAQSIHNASPRVSGPFVAVNCASFPESLLESELFGYVEGSFTDARKGGKMGLFEQGHRGTIFLDEIGDMSLSVQAKVLRVLQEKEVMRLGDDRVIPVDIRIIAATNSDLWNAVREGKFREDLFYRVNVLTLKIPPLRERAGDTVLLARNIFRRLAPHLPCEPDAFRPLLQYPWPGNVRELYNFIEQLVVLHEGSVIGARDVAELLASLAHSVETEDAPVYLKRRISDEALLSVLKKYNGNYSRVSEALGIHRSTLWRRLKKLESVRQGRPPSNERLQ